jgi:hypothetical protein
MTSPFSSLAPLAATLRQRQALVHNVSQVSLVLRGNSISELFNRNQKIILRWMEKRAGRYLPEGAWSGETFELEEVGAQRTSAISIPEAGYWAARIDDADKTVPQRTWTTEIGLARNADGSVLLGSRLMCIVRGEFVPFDRSVPGFVKQIVEGSIAEFDGRQVSSSPWLVETEVDVDDLISLLARPSRRGDVIVIALPEGSTNPEETAVSATEVATRTAGVAHVAIITGPASFRLSDKVGKEFSVFRRAVRTYRPGFDLLEDEPFSHPLALPHRIEAWPNGGSMGYQKLLISQALIRSTLAKDSEQLIPSFASVRRAAAELRSKHARAQKSSDTDFLALADEEIASLRKTIADDRDTYQGIVQSVEMERDAVRAQNEQLRATNLHLRDRIANLESQVKSTGGHIKQDIPNSLDDFEDWCKRSLGGSVLVHNRAYQGIKKSEYEDSRLVYHALVLLRDYYVPMRRDGGLKLKSAYEGECKRLGLEEQPTFSGNRAGEHGDEYFIKFAGQRRELDRHLKKGNAHDARRCFRLYFFWDDDENQAVVGWLPSHLDTRVT